MSKYYVRYIVDGKSYTPEDVLCEVDSEYYYLTKEFPKKKRFSFKGWKCDSGDTSIIYNPGERVWWNFECDACFTAVWESDLYSKYMIPEVLRGSKDFSIFTSVADEQFLTVEKLIDNFYTLIDPDKAPYEFVKLIAKNLGFDFSENISEEFAREALMRILDVYRDRGTDKDIIQAATHGNNLGWLGGNLFDPNYPVSKQKARLEYPKDKMFTHNISKHSGGDRFADDGRWGYGVVNIKVPYIDEYIKEAIRKTVPAGIRYYIDLENTFYSDEVIIEDYMEWVSDQSEKIVLSSLDIQEYQNWERTGRIIFNSNHISNQFRRIKKIWNSDGVGGSLSFGNKKVGTDWLCIYNIEVRSAEADTTVFSKDVRKMFSGRRVIHSLNTLYVDMGVCSCETSSNDFEVIIK